MREETMSLFRRQNGFLGERRESGFYLPHGSSPPKLNFPKLNLPKLKAKGFPRHFGILTAVFMFFTLGGFNSLSWLQNRALAAVAVTPTSLSVTVSGGGEVTLSWTSSDSTVTKHQYQQKKGSSGTYGSWTDITSSASGEDNDESFEVTGLEHDTYYFKVRAVNSEGDSGESNEASIEVETVPGKPTLEVSYFYHNSFGWQIVMDYTADNHGSAITGYNVKFSTQANALALPDSGEGGSRESSVTLPAGHSLVGFALGNTYQIKVWATNTHGEGPESETVDFEFAALVAGPITDLAHDSDHERPGEVRLTWTAGSGRGSTLLRHEYRQREDGGTYPETWTSIADSGASGANDSSYVIKNLAQGTYDFQVRAVNSVGAGDPGEVTGVVVEVVPEPPVLNAITVSYPSTSPGWDLLLTWEWGSEDIDIDEHLYKVKKDSGSYHNWEGIKDSGIDEDDGSLEENGKSYTHGVTSPGTYYFKLLAENAIGRSSESNEVSIVVNAAVPKAIADLQGTASGSGGVTLSWTTPFNGGSAITRHEYRQKLSSGTYPPTWTGHSQ